MATEPTVTDPIRSMIARSAGRKKAQADRLRMAVGGFSPLDTVPDIPPGFNAETALSQAVADQAAADAMAARNPKAARAARVRARIFGPPGKST